MERSATAEIAVRAGSGDRSALFQSNVVAEQLRYGGILSAVKVARSGMPNRFHFLDFYHRYQSIANPAHPAYASLLPRLSEKDDEKIVKAQCELLLQTLTSDAATPIVVSVLHTRLEEESATPAPFASFICCRGSCAAHWRDLVSAS